MNIRSEFPALFTLLVTGFCAALLAGCATDSVIATTATVIGVELSENPATHVPVAKLGYNRAEFAYVPTNRSDESPGKRSGAPEVADVIMELKYAGIFSWGKEGGIYLRLAVEPNAVKQPGAAYIFARDAGGAIEAEAARSIGEAFNRSQAIPQSIAMSFARDVYEALKNRTDEGGEKAASIVKSLDRLGALYSVYDFEEAAEDEGANFVWKAIGRPLDGDEDFTRLIGYRDSLLGSIKAMQDRLNEAELDDREREKTEKNLESQKRTLDEFDRNFGCYPEIIKAYDYFTELLTS